MCGIIGYIGKEKALPVILNGLRRMEYRGYDSSGVAIFEPTGIVVEKKQGKLINLEKILTDKKFSGTVGLGHIRWATHGAPSDLNAHPHTDCKNEIFVIHNGIIENANLLKKELVSCGHIFSSETDSEIFAHLIEEHLEGNSLEEAVTLALKKVIGTYGLAVLCSKEPEKIVAARLGSPLVLGLINGGDYMVSSDITSLLSHTRQVIYCEDYEIITLTRGKYAISTFDRRPVAHPLQQIEWDLASAEKGGYAHFMEKEIFEQPEALRMSTLGRMIIDDGVAKLGGLESVKESLRAIDKIILVACGTARYAALVGEYMLEEYARIPVEVEYASEFRYRQPLLTDKTAVIAISQSGETADTLAAIREAKRKGAITLGIINVVGSSIAREVKAGVYNHIGPEIAVASTKAFTSALAILTLLTVTLGRDRQLSFVQGKNILAGLAQIPEKIEKILKAHEPIRAIAQKYASFNNIAFLGRKYNAPIALEGAHKLKEISYIHAEGFAAGEMKHGALAMIGPDFPSVVIAPKDSVYEKTISNIQEIKARQGKVIAIATEGDEEIRNLVDEIIYIPEALEMLTPLLTVVPLQLLAYYIAVERHCDIDQPRNLAKSVTVE